MNYGLSLQVYYLKAKTINICFGIIKKYYCNLKILMNEQKILWKYKNNVFSSQYKKIKSIKDGLIRKIIE